MVHDYDTTMQCAEGYDSLDLLEVQGCIHTFIHSKALQASVIRKPSTTLSTVI